MGVHTSEFLAALRAVAGALEESGAPSAIIGGVSVVARGVARFTADIDASIDGAQAGDLEALLRLLGRHGIVPRIQDALGFVRQSQVLLLEHQQSGIEVDLSIAWIPWETDAFTRAEEVDFAGVRIRIPAPEDQLVYKLVASRPKDLEDATMLAQLHASRIDFSRVRRVLAEFCEALEDTSRLTELDRIEESIKRR